MRRHSSEKMVGVLFLLTGENQAHTHTNKKNWRGNEAVRGCGSQLVRARYQVGRVFSVARYLGAPDQRFALAEPNLIMMRAPGVILSAFGKCAAALVCSDHRQWCWLV